MRLFIASSFEPGFVDALEDITAYARANAGRDAVKWVERRNFHLSYAFLGELPESGAKAAAGSLDAALEGRGAFTLATGGIGAFPSSRNPRVLWLGINEGAGALREMAEKLAQEMAGRGLIFENRFEPHITLGRVKKPLPENFFRRVSDYALAAKAVCRLASVEVMESVLTPDGPLYGKVHSKRLCNNAGIQDSE